MGHIRSITRPQNGSLLRYRNQLLILRSSSDRFRLQNPRMLLNLTVPTGSKTTAWDPIAGRALRSPNLGPLPGLAGPSHFGVTQHSFVDAAAAVEPFRHAVAVGAIGGFDLPGVRPHLSICSTSSPIRSGSRYGRFWITRMSLPVKEGR